jgi:hypothetical protein
VRHLTALTPTFRLDPKAVRITQDEILADLRYPANAPVRAVPRSSHPPRGRR